MIQGGDQSAVLPCNIGDIESVKSSSLVLMDSFDSGGVYCKFYPGKTDFSLYLPLVSICFYMHWYFLIYFLIS